MKFVSISPDGAVLFDSLIMEAPAFVKFYHPACGHCKDMAPEWAALKNEDFGDLDVNIVEVHADAIPNIKSECAKQVQGYPTIMSVPAGGGKGREFGGGRTCKEFTKHIKSFFRKGGGKGQSGGTRRRKVRGRRASRRRRVSRRRPTRRSKRQTKRHVKKRKTRRARRRIGKKRYMGGALPFSDAGPPDAPPVPFTLHRARERSPQELEAVINNTHTPGEELLDIALNNNIIEDNEVTETTPIGLMALEMLNVRLPDGHASNWEEARYFDQDSTINPEEAVHERRVRRAAGPEGQGLDASQIIGGWLHGAEELVADNSDGGQQYENFGRLELRPYYPGGPERRAGGRARQTRKR